MNSWNKQNVTKDVLIDDILAQRKCDWFYDMPLHTNYVGNREISRSVCRDYLAQMIKNPKKKPQYLQAAETGKRCGTNPECIYRADTEQNCERWDENWFYCYEL